MYCEKDVRFRLISQENGGVSAARNTGLDEAKGDYILFVDSDDSLFPETLQEARYYLISGHFDWIMFDYVRKVSPGDSLPSLKNKELFLRKLDCETALKGLLDSRDSAFAVVWNKLYTRRIIGNIRFKIIDYSEDFLFNYEIYRQTRQSIHIEHSLYCWRIRTESATTVNTPNRFLSQFESMSILECISRGDKPATRGLCLKKIYNQLLIARFHLMGTDLYPAFVSIAKGIRDNSFKSYLSHRSISLFEKIRVILLWSCPQLVKATLKAMGN